MRDLDMIEEHDLNGGGRRLGTIAMATLAFLGLSAAVGVVVGRAARPTNASSEQDPLAGLQTRAQLKRHAVAATVTHVDAAEMGFPNTLKKQEDRPEVLAALAAAAQEARTLDVAGEAPVASAAMAAQATSETNLIDVTTEDTSARLSKSMPAFVAASSAQRALATAAERDPLVRAAIPARDPNQEVAPPGEEGQFNLQVISYIKPDEAAAFADGLRAKGHSAFVMAADIPDRGRYYRVRVGPFESRWRAERYRRKFEKTEQMNTYVVRRPKELTAKKIVANSPAVEEQP